MVSLELKELINSDIYRYSGGIKNFTPRILWSRKEIALYYSIVLRKAHYYTLSGSKLRSLYYRYKLNKLMRKFLIQIPYPVEIGAGFCMVHFGRIVMAPAVKIGRNCNVFTGVTIGSTVRGKNAGVPTIGNEVWIGPNAVLVGNIKIGDDVLIAGNSYVNFDVPDHSIVIGNPGEIVAKDNATQGYITSKWKAE